MPGDRASPASSPSLIWPARTTTVEVSRRIGPILRPRRPHPLAPARAGLIAFTSRAG
jgi:hypothetical protein